MTQTLLLFAGLLISFLVGLFYSRKTSQTDATVIDLTNKIKSNQAKADAAQKDADQKTKDYLDALKVYDPNFDNDDNGGKPSAKADETQCRTVLKDCNVALQSEINVNALQKQIIDDQNKRFDDQSEELSTEQIWKPIAIGAGAAALIEGLLLAFKH